MNNIDKLVLIICGFFIGGGILIGLMAVAQLSENKDCYQTDFKLTHIEEKSIDELAGKVIPLETVYNPNDDYIIPNDEYIIPKGQKNSRYAYKIYGIENGTSVTRDVIEKLRIDEIRELFPNGDYIANYCPEISQDLEIEYNLRGLIDVNRINKWLFR